MKKHLSTLILFLVLLIGLSLLLYPSVSNWWNSMHQSRAIANYDVAMSNMQQEDYESYFTAAERYNGQLAAIESPLINHEQVPGYGEALDVSGSGIMGYITIPAINVELPVYHGTSEGVLQVAVGHVEGSSLPVGGENTHSVLSAHRGLPSARLFTDLDKISVGDIFTLSVLDRLLSYEVDQILIVLPSEADALAIEAGKDLCTLVTCTPYGVNTHRLLVRGRRIENPEEVKTVRVTADAVQIEPLIVTPVVAAPMLLVLLILLLLQPKKRSTPNGGDTFESK